MKPGYITARRPAMTDLRVTHALTGAAWPQATLITDALPGQQSVITATLPYTSGARYFALKSEGGAWQVSGLSNNAFWPVMRIYLPLVLRE